MALFFSLFTGSLSYVFHNLDSFPWILIDKHRRYRNMCRFFAGVIFPCITFWPNTQLNQFWFRHELLAQYRYYWRYVTISIMLLSLADTYLDWIGWSGKCFRLCECSLTIVLLIGQMSNSIVISAMIPFYSSKRKTRCTVKGSH